MKIKLTGARAPPSTRYPFSTCPRAGEVRYSTTTPKRNYAEANPVASQYWREYGQYTTLDLAENRRALYFCFSVTSVRCPFSYRLDVFYRFVLVTVNMVTDIHQCLLLSHDDDRMCYGFHKRVLERLHSVCLCPDVPCIIGYS